MVLIVPAPTYIRTKTIVVPLMPLCSAVQILCICFDGGHSDLCEVTFHSSLDFVVIVHSLRCVQLFATPRPAARQVSLSFTISWSLLKLMSIESVMPSKHLILCCPLLVMPSIFPSIRVFSYESVLHIGVSASASVLPVNIQD